ncbi:uncharacterized protein [Antedon mediterranea]|uniref:uncharacterized protein n=1 Tax=Antedon mediterranea TaxID=105859 RepID=UPI003AF8B058
MKMKTLNIVILGVILIDLVGALPMWPRGVDCPARCICTITNDYLYPLRQGVYQKVDCANKGLNFIPRNLPPETNILLLNNNRIRSIGQAFRSVFDLKYLDLSYNNFQFIKEGVFDYNRNLELINLGWNSIQTLEDAVFRRQEDMTDLTLAGNKLTEIPYAVSSLRTLQVLQLYQNQITSLENNPFVGLDSLQFLNLHDNQISKIEGTVFLRNPELSNIYLNANKIQSIPANLFRNLRSLDYLALSDNQITNFHVNTFRMAGNIRSLDLQRNQLTTLPSGLFVGMSRLREINLQENMLRTIPHSTAMFRGLNNLRTIDLSKNTAIGTLPPGIFSNLPNLETITLSHLTGIDATTFYGLPHLKTLKITDSSINTLSNNIFKDNRLLEQLSLPKCGISTVEQRALFGLSKLRSIDFSDNRLTFVDGSMFAECQLIAIETLHLQYNKIRELSVFAFRNMETLINLRLDNNKIPSLPAFMFNFLRNLRSLEVDHNSITFVQDGALSGLMSLARFDISNNPINCDCTILPFTRWINNNKNKIFSLTQTVCGSPSIYAHNPITTVMNTVSGTPFVCIPPSITSQPKAPQIFIKVGTHSKLPCDLQEHVVAEQVWTIPLNRKITVGKTPTTAFVIAMQHITALTDGTLVIQNAGYTDSGKYTCTATNSKGITSITYNILVVDFVPTGGVVAPGAGTTGTGGTPGAGTPGGGTPGVGTPGGGTPGGGTPGGGTPGVGTPGGGTPGAGTPGGGTPGAGTPGGGIPGAGTPGGEIPGAGTPGGGIPGGGTPGGGTPGVGIPGAWVPGAGIPGAGTPGAGIPGAGTPGAGIPGAGTPGAEVPGAGTPGVGTPGAGGWIPGGGTPGVGTPGVGTPGAGVPGAGTPGAGTPGAGTPGVWTPNFGTPGFWTPNFGTPGFGTPGFGTPGGGTPGVGTPGAGIPGAGTPGVGIPGAGTPGAGTPGAGTPGVGLPGRPGGGFGGPNRPIGPNGGYPVNPGNGVPGYPGINPGNGGNPVLPVPGYPGIIHPGTGNVLPSRVPHLQPTRFPHTTPGAYDPHPCTPSPCLHGGKCTEIPADGIEDSDHQKPKVTSKTVIPVAVAEPVVLMAKCTCTQLWGGRYCEVRLPGRPKAVQISNTHSNYIQIKWHKGEINGDLSGYKVLYRKMGGDQPIEVSMPLDPDVKSFTLHQLETEATYRICVVAYNTGGESDLGDDNCILAHTNKSDKTKSQDNISILTVSLGGLGLLIAIVASAGYYRYNHKKNKPVETMQQRTDNLKKGLQKKGRGAAKPAREPVRPETIYYSHSNDSVMLLDMNPQIPSMMYLNPSAAPPAPQKAIKPKPKKRLLQIQSDLE